MEVSYLPTYLAAANELDELIEQWPCNQARILALLAVRAAFFENGAVHWDVEKVHEEDQTNIHAQMLQERRGLRRFDPEQAARHAQNFALAEAALIESQRRKQGLPTGKMSRQTRPQKVKRVMFSTQNC